MYPTARLVTALQLGVLVGFVVVAPKWNPDEQELPVMRAMCKTGTNARLLLSELTNRTL